MMEAAEIEAGLRALGQDAANLHRLQGGNSSEIWAFEGATSDGGTAPLILRAGMDNEFAFAGRGAEVAVLRAIAGSDVPAPRIHGFDATGAHFGRPAMVMDRCPGAADRNLMNARNRLGLTADDQVALGGEMMDLLARLHAIDAAALAADAPPLAAADHLDQHDAAIAALEAEPMVELRYASWWLRRNLPPAPVRPVFVHGDWRPANMLVDTEARPARVSAVLDWEFTHLGDPAEDLGWYCTPYYAAEHLVPGRFDAEAALARYEAAAGHAVDRAAVRFWAVFAMYKLAYMTVAALRWTVDGDASRMAASGDFIIAPLIATVARFSAEERQAA